MIHLLKNILLRSQPKQLLITGGAMGLFFVLFLGGVRRSFTYEDLVGVFLLVVLTIMMVAIPSILLGLEFDLVLPFKRRAVFVAYSLSVVLLQVFTILIIMAPMMLAYSQGCHWVAVHNYVNIIVFCAATTFLCLWLLPLIKRRPELFVGAMIFLFIFFTICITAEGKILSSETFGLLPSAVALPVGALFWFLGLRRFERFELLPGVEAEGGLLFPSHARKQAGNRSLPVAAQKQQGLIDRRSPFIRVMWRAIWFRWWYALLVFYVAMFVSSPFFFLFFLGIMLPVYKISGYISILSPLVRRETVLRCVLAPLFIVFLLVAGVASLIAHSTLIIMEGFAGLIVYMLWLWLSMPSAKDYSKPCVLKIRGGLMLCVWLFMLLGLPLYNRHIPGVADCIARLRTEMNMAISKLGNDWLVLCVMALVLWVLWRLCERKVRHLESTPIVTKG